MKGRFFRLTISLDFKCLFPSRGGLGGGGIYELVCDLVEVQCVVARRHAGVGKQLRWRKVQDATVFSLI